ncbi:mRNA-decapping enzyme 1B [Holothuria leucospilota]|uniref:mRNA-decapping enzyme 1B n=1 Tax=Holothuria leucospilota TaxID=206669 RepID=A0A9Q1CLP0_HOLLE|nr:mRNA-decapping enzyme 1B [Holothuria leucospilota]
MTKSGTQKDPANAEGRNSESQVIRPIPMRGDSQLKGPKTPQEVGAMNVAQVKGQPHDSVPATGAPKFKRSTSMQETLPKDGQTEGSNVHGKSEQVPPLLQRLFSHSDASVVQPKSEGVKTVESLERLHLAEVEGRDLRKWETSTNADGKKPIDNLLQMLSHSEEQASSQRSPVTPQSLQGKLSKASGDLHSSHTSDSQLVAHEAPHRIALKGLNSSLMTPLNTLPEHTQSSGLSSIVQSRGSSGSGISSPHEVGAGGDPGAGLFTLEQFTDSSEGAVVPTSPQTIPASFTPSKLLTPSLIQKKPSSSGLLVPTAVTAKSEPPQAARVSPIPTLTKEQFKEAYIFMLQNDSEFVSKLYDAYLQVQSKPKT